MTFLVFLLACGAAASTSLFFKPGQRYVSLTKPGSTPPVITGLILHPYLAWLCVAAALNFSILRNNR
jgi:benzodiazapine receptor